MLRVRFAPLHANATAIQVLHDIRYLDTIEVISPNAQDSRNDLVFLGSSQNKSMQGPQRFQEGVERGLR